MSKFWLWNSWENIFRPSLMSLCGWIPLNFSRIFPNFNYISLWLFMLFQPSSPNWWWDNTSYRVILLDMIFWNQICSKLITIMYWQTFVRYKYHNFTDTHSSLSVTVDTPYFLGYTYWGLGFMCVWRGSPGTMNR